MKNKVIIIGAGPGGLVAGLILQNKGFEVEIYEKESRPGGRNSFFMDKGHKFDIGPTFLMMKYVLDEVFSEIGLKSEDYLEFTRLSPMYRLYYHDRKMDVYQEKSKMKKELKKTFPGEELFLDKFHKRESRRFKYMMPCLLKDYSSFLRFFSPEFLKALPHFSFPRSLFGVLGSYFKNPHARIAFTFQSKYLGMSPWECPGAFAMIPFVEHDMGIYHVKGGLSKISEVMAAIFEKKGGKIHYSLPVNKIHFEGKRARWVELEGKKRKEAGNIVINADFGQAMKTLMPKGKTTKYSDKKLKKKRYSCSTFMLYLGLKKEYDLKHHNIIFAPEYRRNVEEVFSGKLSDGNNLSFYVRYATAEDKTVSPKGRSQLYILVPTPNKQVGKNINWKRIKQNMRDDVLKLLRERMGLSDIEENIETERIITPDDWVNDHGVFNGATFNLAHNLGQMLWFRPHNRLEGTNNCYLVGGGTHPGSGLPTIYESGRISAKMIIKSSK